MKLNTEMNSKIVRETPANEWAEGFPIGNGRIGAMVFGEGTKTVLSLNHELLLRRYLSHPTYKTAGDMPGIKELCMQGKWQEAEELLLRTVPYTGDAIYIILQRHNCELFVNKQ
jgi:alpha-L-fucosidase 2